MAVRAARPEDVQLVFDFNALSPRQAAEASRRLKGRVSYLSGAAAESRIAEDYIRRGFRLLHRRWRGKAGEIDLIFSGAVGLVFVEVKKAKCFDRALDSLGAAQVRRIFKAAEEFAGQWPGCPEMRFDVALMNGWGETRVMENVFGPD